MSFIVSTNLRLCNIAVRGFKQVHFSTNQIGLSLNKLTSSSRNINMATATKIHLTPEHTGIYKFRPQDNDAATKTSELLQENLEIHHVFFNASGFHNHITHHLLTLFALGAPASIIEQRYKRNAIYQRPLVPTQEQIVQDMSKETLKKYQGKEKHYHDFLIFWQKEIEKKGWQDVLNEYVFAGDEQADDLLTRICGGLLHPLIHLGFGVEFQQPAIIAEALSQACVHDNWISSYLLTVENAATTTTNKTIPELLEEIRTQPKLSKAVSLSDANKIRDGILVRAPEEMINIAKQWTVTPENLEAKTAEMIGSTIYFTAAAQHPPKQVKFDFFYIHAPNSSIFFPTFNAQPWLSDANKVRLLKFKVYIDLALYASRNSPPLLLEEITTYTPKLLEKGDAEWPGIYRRLCEYPEDDGHVVKFVRAVAFAEQACKKYENEDWAKIKGFMWEKIGNMIADSVEDTGATWVRDTGFEESWAAFEDRPRSTRL